MISILQIMDKADKNDGSLYPNITFVSRRQARQLANVCNFSQQENICNDGDSSVIIGFWTDSKHPKARKYDFIPCYKIESTDENDEIFIQEPGKTNHSVLLFWNQDNPFDKDRDKNVNKIYGGYKLTGGNFVESFKDTSRSTVSYIHKLRSQYHIDPKKKIKVLAMCPFGFVKEKPKEEKPVVDKPKRKRGRPRKVQPDNIEVTKVKKTKEKHKK